MLPLLWPALALSDLHPEVGAYGGRAPHAALPMAAAGSTKAMALVKRTLVLSPVAAPRTPGSPPRCCSWPPTAWPCKDWSRARSPTASCLPQPHSCSTSTTAVCLLCPQDSLSSSLKTCYKYLNQTSRSFAAVIQALDGEMRLVESPDWGTPLFQGTLSHYGHVDSPLRIMSSFKKKNKRRIWAPCCGLGSTNPSPPHTHTVPTCLLANALPDTWPSTNVCPRASPFREGGGAAMFITVF